MFACRAPLAHLSFDLFGAKRGRYVDDEVFVECCDTYNQDVYDLAYGLASGGFDLYEYFERGPVLHFRGMEVRPPFVMGGRAHRLTGADG